MPSHYETLGVSRNAEPTVIEAAYRALMKRYHPDTRAAAGTDRSAAINEAYSVLRDPAKRAAYDAQLNRKSNGRSKQRTAVTNFEPPRRFNDPDREANKKRCPECAELIQAEARVCRYCGTPLARPPEVRRSAFIEFWRKRTRWWDWVIFGIVALAILIAYASRPTPGEDRLSPPAAGGTPGPVGKADAGDSGAGEAAPTRTAAATVTRQSDWDEYLDAQFGTRVMWRADNSIEQIQFYRGQQAALLEGCSMLPARAVTVLSVDEEEGTFRGRSADDVNTFHVPFEQAPEVVGSWVQRVIQEGSVLRVSSAACGASGSTIVVTGLQRVGQ